jgi:hypothetical protein
MMVLQPGSAVLPGSADLPGSAVLPGTLLTVHVLQCTAAEAS